MQLVMCVYFHRNGGHIPVQQDKMRLILTPSSLRRMKATKKNLWRSLPYVDWILLTELTNDSTDYKTIHNSETTSL